MFSRLKNHRAERARRKVLSQNLRKSNFNKRNFAATVAVVFALSAVLYAICFANKAPIIPQMTKMKSAQINLVSLLDFSYKSELQTQANRERNAERIPPLYKTNIEIVKVQQNAVNRLRELIDDRQPQFDALSGDKKKSGKFFEDLSGEIRKNTDFAISPEDLKTIYENTSLSDRARTFGQVFFHAKNILRDGIYADGDAVFSNIDQTKPSTLAREFGSDSTAGIGLADKKIAASEMQSAKLYGSMNTFNIRAVSESNARRELLEKTRTLGLNDALAYALYRTLNQTLRLNVEFDEQQTKKLRDEARARVKDVIVKVREGDTLADSNTAQSPLVAEKIKAYTQELKKRGAPMPFSKGSVEFMFCLLLVMTGTFFILISKTRRNKYPRTIAIFCTLLILNLGIERAIVEMGNSAYFDSNTTMLQLFSYVAPLMLGPIIQVLLFGSYTGFIMALMVAAFTTMMIDESIMYFVIFLASALVAIYFCASASTRPQVVLGGVIYGLFISAVSLILGICIDLPMEIVWRRSLLAVLSGAGTGLLALAILPIIERLFKRYSNVTLLDYTDFNNPLLRKMQIEAPGTYHHCIMVSYLAEAAALAVNANPMVCRVGALYHDIGKIQKPEFFTENQGGGKNAHDETNPSMSALIIKNHIREGVEIAKIAKLPQQVIDAIEQHHGKSIISYFYNKAKQTAKTADYNVAIQTLRDSGIEESTYRHEGVLPNTVENAIIMIADCCEAASRSQKNITKHGIDDLVSKIIREKMNDGQLDDCPITVKQLSKIKDSIVSTMLNMLHTRIAYNTEKK